MVCLQNLLMKPEFQDVSILVYFDHFFHHSRFSSIWLFTRNLVDTIGFVLPICSSGYPPLSFIPPFSTNNERITFSNFFPPDFLSTVVSLQFSWIFFLLAFISNWIGFHNSQIINLLWKLIEPQNFLLFSLHSSFPSIPWSTGFSFQSKPPQTW